MTVGPFGFKAVAFFAADEDDRAVPQVSFSGVWAPAEGSRHRRVPPLSTGSQGLSAGFRALEGPPSASLEFTGRAGVTDQTDWPEAIFSSSAIFSSMGGWVS